MTAEEAGPTSPGRPVRRMRRRPNILPATRGWIENRPDAPRPGLWHFIAFPNQCALLTPHMQQEMERHVFGQAILRVALGMESWEDHGNPERLKAAWEDRDRHALSHAMAMRDRDACATWARQHGLHDAWVADVLAVQGGSPRLVGAPSPDGAVPSHDAEVVPTPQLVPLPDGSVIFIGADMRETRMSLPAPRKPLNPPSPLLETREQYMERAAREWEDTIAEYNAQGFRQPKWKRAEAALRDFYLLAEHIVLGRSEAALGQRYFRNAADPKDSAAKAIRNTSRRLGLHRHIRASSPAWK